MKILQWSILGLLLSMLLVGASGQATELLLKSTMPGLSVGLNLKGQSYDQEIELDLVQPVKTASVRGRVLDGSLTEQVSTWVKKAVFSQPDQTGAYNYTLAIGKSFFVYTHQFRCTEDANSETWLQTCTQQPVGKDLVVHNGLNSVECGAPSTNTTTNTVTTHCLFRMKGTASDISVPLAGKVEGGYLAGKLFVENVSYVAHLGLILSGTAQNVDQAKKIFSRSQYAGLVTGLEQKIEAQRARTEIVNVQAQLGFPMNQTQGRQQMLNAGVATR